MRFHRIGERHEGVGHQPIDIRRQQHRADRERHIGRRRTEIGGAARIAQRRNAETGEQRDRPIFGEHGGGGGDAGEHRPADAARFERAQEPPRRQRPERRQHRVGVELDGVNIIERHECQQHDADDALVGRQVTRRKPPRDPQRQRRQQNGETIIGPVLARKHAEPGPQQPGAERRMFRRAEAHLARPRHELAHVGVDVLAALGDCRVERPDGEIADEHHGHGALAARRVDQRIEQTLEAIVGRENERGHRRDIMTGPPQDANRGKSIRHANPERVAPLGSFCQTTIPGANSCRRSMDCGSQSIAFSSLPPKPNATSALARALWRGACRRHGYVP